MEIGKLRHRLELQRGTEVRDTHGGFELQFVTFATVWGFVRPLSGQELIHAQQVESRQTHEVGIRRRDDVDPTQRVKHLTRTFNVLSIQDVNERHFQNLFNCVEVLN